jgi:hypothetical protein
MTCGRGYGGEVSDNGGKDSRDGSNQGGVVDDIED